MTDNKREVPVVRVIPISTKRPDAVPDMAHLALVEELRDARQGPGKVANKPLCSRADLFVFDEEAVANRRAQADIPPLPLSLRELPTCPRCEAIRQGMRKAGPCNKIMRWSTQQLAEEAMARLNAHPDHPPKRALVRAYECFAHRQPCWHLTSRPERPRTQGPTPR